MNYSEKQLIKSYLSNIQVNVSFAGFNKVGTDWRDLDYTPDYNKFYFICSGEGRLKIGDKEYFPKPSQIFLMPQGIKQSYSIISENTFTKYWCHFTAKIGEMNIFDIIKLPHFIEVKDDGELESIFNELLTHNSSMEMSASLMLKASMLRLISYYINNSADQCINISNSEIVEKLNTIIQYIEKNIAKSLTIEELSGMAHLHPNYFIRIFKKHFGASPIHYINKRRIEEAKRLLIFSNLTLTEICDMVGVADIYYLSKLFKDSTGISPSNYRKLNS
ncbi:AraC family transcriptional regulator [Clostridium sp.]|uniref:AraC family transcriptional regulator n=1 Tax=Clostridium sp. TaxID=1506 RepID=UPI00284A5D28|nr:AraC family transcriptional regulator [Clostridium sp.]MDR3593762.1 AraC family transcriptional regulator [Clostridium sp.]